MTDFKPGQKWISNAEPELGMGQVMSTRDRLVSVYFELAGEQRTYSRNEAPLTRVRFSKGDRIATQDDLVITVTSVADRDGVFVYHGDYNGTSTAVVETELDPNVRFSKPAERLFTRQLDDNAWFVLRYRSLSATAALASASSRGLYGPRVSLIPHQLYIASEVGQRFAPRVLLADEVGLGKTIEAGLIIHQQLVIGRARRILIIVPPALTFQWFVELIRKFNLQFTVLDEARCLQIESDNAPESAGESDQTDTNEAGGDLSNPFEAQQLMLCALDLFEDHPRRLAQALAAEWDLVAVDEAHHLGWRPGNPSPQYEIVEAISGVARGLLLLTATPEQLGRAGHFARLRLLDPDRFHDYDRFLTEETRYEAIATEVRRLLEGTGPDQAAARDRIRAMTGVDGQDDDDLIDRLLDRHGTGRVLFRNVRSSVGGFPRRKVIGYPLPCPPEFPRHQQFPELGGTGWAEVDPRVTWLIDRLTSSTEKHLVICAHRQVVIELDRRISERTSIRSTVFHEGMDLVARDRAANYFSETERGAGVLICSEIGSEGRNFQFASHLVLFDLPAAPDLLEQRIGRLDRIGQAADVTVHIPYLTGTPQAALFHWFHDGMDLFSEPNPVAQGIYDELAPRFAEVAAELYRPDTDGTSEQFQQFIEVTRKRNRRQRREVSQGRDRLLELNSHRPDIASAIVNDIVANEGGDSLASYMESSFELFGLESEPLGDRVFHIKPTESMQRNAAVSIETAAHFHYPELPEDGIRVTFDRETGLAREDVAFLTWENPLVQQAVDLVLSDVTGNSAAIAIRHPAIKPGTLMLETLSVVECVAPAWLEVQRYMPPAVHRCLITPTLTNIAGNVSFQSFADRQMDVPAAALRQIIEGQKAGIKSMLETSEKESSGFLTEQQRLAYQRIGQRLEAEIERLEALATVNPGIRPEEIDQLRTNRGLIQDAIRQAAMRLDAVRVIITA